MNAYLSHVFVKDSLELSLCHWTIVDEYMVLLYNVICNNICYSVGPDHTLTSSSCCLNCHTKYCQYVSVLSSSMTQRTMLVIAVRFLYSQVQHQQLDSSAAHHSTSWLSYHEGQLWYYQWCEYSFIHVEKRVAYRDLLGLVGIRFANRFAISVSICLVIFTSQ
jgi:hypothetical protein